MNKEKYSYKLNSYKLDSYKLNSYKSYNLQKKNKYKNKYNNIFILTIDEKYFIIDKKVLYKSNYLNYLFKIKTGIGYLGKPIYLQNVKSCYFEHILTYLKYYKDINDEYINPIINYKEKDILNYYQNPFDKKYIKNIINIYENNLDEFEKFLNTISYLKIDILYQKIKILYNYIKYNN